VEADAALVVVPPPAHVDVAVVCLEAGLDILVEKPFAPSVEEAAQIVRRAEELDRTVMVTQSFRFKRGPQTVRKLIDEGAVGRIEAVEARFAKAPHFGGFREEMDEPLIVDLSIHHFDFLRGILGLEPVRVRALSYNPSWSWFRGNAAAFVQFATEDGAKISYNGSWVSKSRETTWDGSWEIQGAEGSIVWEHNRVEYRPANFGLTVYRKDMLERRLERREAPLLRQVDRIARGGQRRLVQIDHRRELRVLEVLDDLRPPGAPETRADLNDPHSALLRPGTGPRHRSQAYPSCHDRILGC
jgi:predicted dehydrogenase